MKEKIIAKIEQIINGLVNIVTGAIQTAEQLVKDPVKGIMSAAGVVAVMDFAKGGEMGSLNFIAGKFDAGWTAVIDGASKSGWSAAVTAVLIIIAITMLKNMNKA